MAENVEKRGVVAKRGPRGRWLLLAVLVAAVTAVIVGSRRRKAERAPADDWPISRPAGAGSEWRRPNVDRSPAGPSAGRGPVRPNVERRPVPPVPAASPENVAQRPDEPAAAPAAGRPAAPVRASSPQAAASAAAGRAAGRHLIPRGDARPPGDLVTPTVPAGEVAAARAAAFGPGSRPRPSPHPRKR